ncbi:glycosyl hydrolase [Marinibactrum halimedae]|uniref:GH26 domain-containing protein n=1 Tax=Marinibactrum halimedae TaxID=1444977 RepID=A0AA37WL47_9GAMM|nr:glycosyl hydrolase [Marinibactrum halimedae]MCD9457692.1 hypothetical protein [Marinibactrum halimedae]GLS24935.1 hypothetical protein GCM10007877_06490 [Marinibactrum halimedae]
MLISSGSGWRNFSQKLFGAALLSAALLSGCASQGTQPVAESDESKAITGEPVLLFLGQDTYTIDEYHRTVPEDELEGVTLYTGVFQQATNENFPGVYTPAHWDSGIIDFQKTLSDFPSAALAIGLAFTDKPVDQDRIAKEIAEGKFDEPITRFAQTLRDHQQPVYLRIGHEFDGPWNQYHPASYKAAFRHIHDLLEQAGATNVKTVWHSATWPDKSLGGERASDYDHQRPEMLNDWYPGDDVVDVVGVSVFYRDLTVWTYTPPDTPQRAQDQLLDFARAHHKPVMISEAAPQGYRIAELSRSPIMKNEPVSISAEALWNEWYQPFFDFIDDNRDVITSVAYINTHWDSQFMWHCIPGGQAGQPHCPSGFWGDSRVQVNPLIRERWLKEVLNPKKYLQAGKPSEKK